MYSAVGGPILALDLTTLSMVLRIDAYTVEQKVCSGVSLNFPVRHFGAAIIHSGTLKEVLFPVNTPPDMRLLIQSYAEINGRFYFANIVATTSHLGTWEFLPLTTPRDGWTDTSINNYRAYWAYDDWYFYDQFYALIDPDLNGSGFVKYKTGTPSEPGYPVDGDATHKWLNAVGGDFRNLFFCDNPRWGWHQYSTLLPGIMNVHSRTTFFTHPNGTYAYFDDGWIYDRNGLPGDNVIGIGAGGQAGIGQGSGNDWQRDTLATYDPSKIEHVIFDRVHFEIQAKDRPAFVNNTSFMELYNRAVQKGVLAETLPDAENIREMFLTDLQATFIKEIGSDTDYDFLDLRMTWDGKDWWYRESAYATVSTSFYPHIVGTQGNFNNLNVYSFWRETNYAGTGGARSPGNPRDSEPNNWHFRFANAIVIMEK
jgi:hypothetical protein